VAAALFTKFKQSLRTVKARTKEALDRAVIDALITVTAENAAAWYRYCGYRSTAIVESL